MHVRKLILFAVIVVTAVVAARALGLWVGGQLFSSPTNATPTPALVFAEDDLTFGPIPESEQVERELRITNTSAEPVTIERFEKSCTCLGIEPAANITIQPGETTRLRVKLKTAIPAGAKLSDDGLFSETVNVNAVTTSAPGVRPERSSADVRYTVSQTIRFDPPVVQLGVVSHREPAQVKATLTLLPPIQDVRVLPHPEWDVKLTTKGDNRREVIATPVRSGVPRVVNDLLQVVPVGDDGRDRPERTLTVRGEIKSDIVASPADISLGRMVVGSEVEERFRLLSLTGRPFTVVEATGASPELRVATDGSKESAFVVGVWVAERGDQNRAVRVRVKQDDGVELTVVVPVRYLGHTEN